MVLKNRLIIDNYQVTVSHRRDKNPRIYIYIYADLLSSRDWTRYAKKTKEKGDREETQMRLFTTLHGFLDTFFEVSREPTFNQQATSPLRRARQLTAREENRRKDAQAQQRGRRGEEGRRREERCRLIKEGDGTNRKRRES